MKILLELPDPRAFEEARDMRNRIAVAIAEKLVEALNIEIRVDYTGSGDL